MEIVFEFIFELLIGGLADAQGNSKIPKWLRLIFAAVLCLPFVALFIFFCIMSLENIVLAVFLGILAFAFLAAWLFLCRKIIKFKMKPNKVNPDKEV